jgi:flagellar basal-body rod protein FlgB
MASPPTRISRFSDQFLPDLNVSRPYIWPIRVRVGRFRQVVYGLLTTTRQFLPIEHQEPSMGIGDLPLMSMLRTRMRWHNQRQAVLSENIANADTPGYRGRDMQTINMTTRPGQGLTTTNVAHITQAGVSRGQVTDPRTQRGFETTPRGNAVVLEDEMIKVGQNAQEFQAAATLYQRGLGLLRTATGRRN